MEKKEFKNPKIDVNEVKSDDIITTSVEAFKGINIGKDDGGYKY